MKEKLKNLLLNIFIVSIIVLMAILALDSVINVIGNIFVKIFS